MSQSHEVELAGERLIAVAGKGLYWPSQSTLFVADVHLGKDSAMLATGIPVPFGATTETLGRLTQILHQTRAQKLVLLGDLWHAKQGRSERAYGEFIQWREDHFDVEVVLVEGNHDVKSGRLTGNVRIEEVAEKTLLHPFVLCHYPQEDPSGYVLAGHVHPAVVLEGSGRQAIKLPCFWFGDKCGVLPAFGEFTGCATVSPNSRDQVLVVADSRIFSVSCSTAA